MANTAQTEFYKSNVLGQRSGLFVLFFTEMWERFSFYGMRVLLMQFLTASVIGLNPGWEWTVEQASALYGTYAMMLYLTPIFGGIIADKYIGSRMAVIIGAIIMTIGHAAMAFDTPVMFFIGLACLVIGTGFFKPNMPSILGEMYKDLPEKKDGAYSIFYMGVNAGAFFGMMLCGFLAEKIGWHWGFGLAGIFMFLGTLQFAFAKPMMGKLGILDKSAEGKKLKNNEDTDKRNPFKTIDYILITIIGVIGLLYAFNDPLSKNGISDIFSFMDTSVLRGQYIMILSALALFIYLLVSRILRYDKVVRDRMFAVVLLAFFLIFFFMSFEQGATSLVIFAKENTQRILYGDHALYFNIFNTLLTIIPMLFISYVLIKLAQKTIKQAFLSNVVLIVTFIGIWASALWMLNYNWKSHSYEVSFNATKTVKTDPKTGEEVLDDKGNKTYKVTPITEANIANNESVKVLEKVDLASQKEFQLNTPIKILYEGEKYVEVTPEAETKLKADYAKHNRPSEIIEAQITQVKDSQVEITVSWFSTLNSFFIIALASMVSRLWGSRYNPSAAFKYGFGLILVAIGFLILGLGTYGEDKTVKLSLFFLAATYLFHTLGELFISPVGLSYVSKLVPGRMLAFMFGVWYLAIAIAQKLAALFGGQIKVIQNEHSLSYFFILFTAIPAAAGLLVMLLNPLIKKLMHGIK